MYEVCTSINVAGWAGATALGWPGATRAVTRRPAAGGKGRLMRVGGTRYLEYICYPAAPHAECGRRGPAVRGFFLLLHRVPRRLASPPLSFPLFFFFFFCT